VWYRGTALKMAATGASEMLASNHMASHHREHYEDLSSHKEFAGVVELEISHHVSVSLYLSEHLFQRKH
jgi:hypothetical protein